MSTSIIIGISYLVIVYLVFAIITYLDTQNNGKDDKDIFMHITLSLVWPLFIILAVIIGPFILISCLIRKKKISNIFK